jgi:uncharacterized protein YciI
MLFVIFCIDKPGMGERRAAAMPAHIEYLKNASFRTVMSGPLTSDDGGTIVGSLYVVDAENRRVIDRMFTEDPLCRADIWQSVEVRAFSKRVDNRE